MDFINVIGIVAGTLTTIAFVPQLIQVVKTKSTKDISLIMFIVFSMGVSCWLVYGILIYSWPVIIANAIVFVLALVILSYKIRYK